MHPHKLLRQQQQRQGSRPRQELEGCSTLGQLPGAHRPPPSSLDSWTASPLQGAQRAQQQLGVKPQQAKRGQQLGASQGVEKRPQAASPLQGARPAQQRAQQGPQEPHCPQLHLPQQQHLRLMASCQELQQQRAGTRAVLLPRAAQNSSPWQQ